MGGRRGAPTRLKVKGKGETSHISLIIESLGSVARDKDQGDSSW